VAAKGLTYVSVNALAKAVTGSPAAAAKAIIDEIGTDRARDLARILLATPRKVRSSWDDRYSKKFLDEVAGLVPQRKRT
jgi:hypothetical protein